MIDLRTAEINHEQSVAVRERELVNRPPVRLKKHSGFQRVHVLAENHHVVQEEDAQITFLQQQWREYVHSASSQLRA